jgi:hypothetical protein
MTPLKTKNEPPPKIASELPVPNRDMFISGEILGQFAVLQPLLHNEATEDFFAIEETRANKFKRLFVYGRSISLILVCLLLILMSWRLSLTSLSKHFPLWVDYIAALVGIVALTLQIVISGCKAQSKWLYARFVAERTRQWKYQTLLDGDLISKLLTSADTFKKSLLDRWTLFKRGFEHGIGGMAKFMESSPFEFLVKPLPCPIALFEELKRIYQTFRLEVQIAHFVDRNLRLRGKDRWTDALAKSSLLASGLIAVIEACLWGSHAMGWINIHGEGSKLGILVAVLAASALSFAVISAGIRVYRSASAITEERERYRFKELRLRRIEDRLRDESDPAKALLLMEEAETICTEELQEFLRSLSHADYFL